MQRSLTWLYESIVSPQLCKSWKLKAWEPLHLNSQPTPLPAFQAKTENTHMRFQSKKNWQRKNEGTWNYREFVFGLSFTAIFFWSTRSTCFWASWVSWISGSIEAHWVLQFRRIGNMERVVSCFMGSFLLCAILLLDVVLMASGNPEGGWRHCVLSLWGLYCYINVHSN